MVTQTVEFRAVTGQSVTAKLFPIGSDTQTASAAATEATNRKGTYSASYTNIAAGTYDLIAFVEAVPVARWQTTLTLTTATFQAYEPVSVTGGDASAANQQLILDQLDVIQTKTDTIGTAAAVTSLLAGAVLDPGTITSFPPELVIGDSYQETDGREIQIPLVDTDGNVLTTVGSRNLVDATATFEIRRINESDSSRVITGTATIVDPPGTSVANAPYAVIQLPASETSKGLPSYRYYGKITLEWSGPGTDIMSFKTDVIKFTY